MMLLQQMYQDGGGNGTSSRWAPYFETMRMRVLAKPVLRELKGTYAAELHRTWDDEAKVVLRLCRLLL